MNYFVEGLQGSGKSTLVSKLQELHPELKAVREGEYSPVELAWCAYLDEEKYPKSIRRSSRSIRLFEKRSRRRLIPRGTSGS